ncbi:unnamed protein product [marine sediment metagenome]|uniref:Uncharacterized protein n=1 Tax=marine sediment metagenome TaxID=412755 RepID=X1AHQ5_9ZZZZ
MDAKLEVKFIIDGETKINKEISVKDTDKATIKAALKAGMHELHQILVNGINNEVDLAS